MFQSAPRSGERGDVKSAEWVHPLPWFQSAPRSGERGDVRPRARHRRRQGFNPRLAPESEAMLGPGHLASVCQGFNPRLAPESEAIGRRRATPGIRPVSIRASLRRARRWRSPAAGRSGSCFNPRLAPESEAIGIEGAGPAAPRVSIRASLRRARRSAGLAHVEFLYGVSIRASLRRARRCADLYTDANSALFQSAPRSGERGDVHEVAERGRASGFNPRLAPESEAIVIEPHDRIGGVVSIRASLRRARRSQGDAGRVEAREVSIRASLRRARRCASARPSSPRTMFQSAPRSGERGDATESAP